MFRRCPLVVLLALVVLPAAVAQDQAKHKMTVDDLLALKRVSDPAISPDGQWVVYTVAAVDLAKNKYNSSLWLAPTGDGKPKHLFKDGTKGQNAHWSPDGKALLFEAEIDDQTQLFLTDRDGAKPKQLTSIATGAENGVWSPDGQWVAFVSTVYPEYSAKPFKESDPLNKKRLDDEAKNPVKALTFTKLFFRHWNVYLKDKRRHLFVIPSAGGEPKNLTPGDRDADPVSQTFSSGQDFTFSPDSKYLYFTAAPKTGEAWTTNYDIMKVPVGGGKIENLTKDNEAADNAPRFSPDGKWLAYRAQKRPGFEADRWQLYIVPAGAENDAKKTSLTADLDSSVEDFVWGADSDRIYFTAEEKGHVPLYVTKVPEGKVKKLGGKHTLKHLTLSKDGKKLAYSRSAMTFPPEAVVYEIGAKDVNVSRANADLLSKIELPEPTSVTVPGAGGTPMQMWILKPPGFEAQKKWPLLYLVHGGPQGAWNDGWSFRWCPQLWAAQGYVIAMPNPRGSTGFGQKYTDEISGDWGGKVFDDLMAGMDYLEKQPYVDKDRTAAAGASFGGYMMNWFQGHTTRFKTLITHAGVYNLESMYGTTEELWFVEWDVGGKPWTDPEKYRKFSPHAFAKDFKTPMLIVHGEKDFRVPYSEGLQMFTTLQRLGIPSKMVLFPDEGHFILKPRNSEYWHAQIFAWLKKYVPPGGQ
jgi:dipeptidyl aminopeptidase/acylaminoacyl peptidase